MKRSLALALVMTMAVAAPALAHDRDPMAPPPPPPVRPEDRPMAPLSSMEGQKAQADMMASKYWFSRMDANHDGKISVREHEMFSADNYHRADMNNDGVITMDEFMKYRQAEMMNLKSSSGYEQDRTEKHFDGMTRANMNK